MNSFLFPPLPILIVDDEQAARDGFEIALASFGYTNVVTLGDSRDVLPFLQKNQVEMVFLDLIMPHLGGMELLEQIRVEYPEVPVIIVSAISEIDSVVHCIRHGAQDYILKPVDSKTLCSRMRKYFEIRDIEKENQRLRETLLRKETSRPEAFASIVTRHPAMLQIFQYCEAVAPSKRPVLICGETGTGKELIARALHQLSDRKGNFVAVNVAALDDAMFTDALFGHVKGAFTGAEAERQGLVAKAWGGTLFLDEIGDLSLASQVKLLRLLQEEEYFPLGSDVPRRANVRVVSSTMQPLRELKRDKKFREDLYFRFATHHVQLPPLRDRLEDLPLLLRHFLYAELGEDMEGVEWQSDLLDLLHSYHFPGNVRELQSMVVDAVSSHAGGRVLASGSFRRHIQAELGEEGVPPSCAVRVSTMENTGMLRLKEAQEKLSRELVSKAMALSGGNQTIAARHLGITQQALSLKLKKFRPSGE